MNRQEAILEVEKYKNLIGRFVAGNHIIHLLVAPACGGYLGDLVYLAEQNKSADELLSRHNEFKIVVAYNTKSIFNDGVVYFENLIDTKIKLNV